MEAKITIKLNSHTRKIPITVIEGITYRENSFTKPNAKDSNWIFQVKVNVSDDNTLDITCLAIGKSLHKADASIKIQYSGKEKTVEIENDEFGKTTEGILIINEKIAL